MATKRGSRGFTKRPQHTVIAAYAAMLFCAFLFALHIPYAKADDSLNASPDDRAFVQQPIALSGSICALPGNSGASPEQIIARRGEFDCTSDKMDKATDHFWMVTDITKEQTGFAVPVLRYRAARHGDVTIYRKFNDGRWLSTHHDMADMTANWRTPWAVAAPLLGPSGERPETLLISVNQPWNPSNLSDVQIWEAQQDIAVSESESLLSALFIGLLFAPLLLNIIFFATLRQRFILFHSLMLVAILGCNLFWTGLIFELAPNATMVDRSIGSHISLAVLAFAICMLVHSLCDPQKLGQTAYRALPAVGVLGLATTMLILAIAPDWPLVGSRIFNAVYGLMVATVTVSLVTAATRGDRLAMLQILGLSGFLVVAISRLGRAMGWLAETPMMDSSGFHFAVLLEVLVTSLIVGMKIWQLRQNHDHALRQSANEALLARTDSLTQIMNRRGFMEQFRALEQDGRAPSKVTALILVDIDHFKRINDKYGHDAGDMVLIQMAQLLQQCCRKGDSLARFGGEEFAILAQCSDTIGIRQLARRIQQTISEMTFGNPGKPVGAVSVSMGVTQINLYPTTLDFDHHYRAADRALYRAKNMGRNRICHAEDDDNLAQGVLALPSGSWAGAGSS
ncbi:MAG: diguanylate cyclase [Pseudomonadota bacterium]